MDYFYIDHDDQEKNRAKEILEKSEAIIKASELQILLKEFEANGHNDLRINRELLSRIREYLAYQVEADPLKRELAKRFINQYFFAEDVDDMDEYNPVSAMLYVNEREIAEIEIFDLSSNGNYLYRGVDVDDFILILSAIGNCYSNWIDNLENNNIIDLARFICDIGGRIKIEEVDEDETDDYDYEYRVKISLNH